MTAQADRKAVEQTADLFDSTLGARRLQERYRSETTTVTGPWNAVIATLLNHRSVRAFSDEQVSDDILERAIAVAQSAATSSNLQAWSVIAVRDGARKARLAELAGSQAYVAKCPLFLLWLVDLSRIERIGDEKGRETDALKYTDTFLSGLIDVSLAAQNAVSTFESLGLGTTYIGGMRNRPMAAASELDLPASVMVAFGMCVGYPDPKVNTAIKPRLPSELVIHREKYKHSIPDAVLVEYDARARSFQVEQGMKPSGWTDHALERMRGPEAMSGRDKLKDEMTGLGFRML